MGVHLPFCVILTKGGRTPFNHRNRNEANTMREQKFEIEPILRKYMNGTCSKEEFQQFREFLKRPDSAEIIDQLLSEEDELGKPINSPNQSKKSRILFEKIKEQVDQYDNDHLIQLFKEHKKKSRGRTFFWLKAAVLLLVVSVSALGLWYFNQTGSTAIAWREKQTQRGQKATITLTDGSTVVLNADTKLSYPERFGEATREVILQGEAFFMVSKDEKPFLVRSENLVIKVMGTSFNIRAYPESNTQVTVATGKVSVAKAPTSNNNKSEKQPDELLLLTPNEQATYDRNTHNMFKKQVDTDRVFAWREGTLMFTAAKFHEVVNTLQRWYGTEIVLENEAIGNCVVSFESKNESLENVLKALQFIIDIEYEFINEEVVISGNGCS